MQNSSVIQKVLGKIGAYLSRLSLPNLLVGLIIFSSATQLGLHFWPSSSLVYGIRIDYLAPTIYFLDLLIISYLVIQPKQYMTALAKSPIMTIGLPIIMTNLIYSQNPLATLSWSLHFLLYLLFLRTVLKRNSWLQAKKGSAAAERTVLYGILRSVLPLSLLFQLILALTQTYLGHSVGGLMYYLGERSVAVGSPNIALGMFMDSVVLRAYGTFSHPNILAGWSVIVLLILLQLAAELRSLRDYRRVIVTFASLIATLIVLLTQSRSAALSLFGIIIPFYLLKNFKSRAIYFFVGLLVCWFVSPSFLSPSRSDLSTSQRLTLQGLSLSVIRSFPVFGTGAQASISTYPAVSPTNRLLQPDHNSFTLFLSWFGIFGFLAILYLLKSKILNLKSILPIAPLLALDHYFLTSPQGLFILLLYIQVALNYRHVQNYRK